MNLTYIKAVGVLTLLIGSNAVTYTYQEYKYNLAIEQLKSQFIFEINKANEIAQQHLDAARTLGNQLSSELESKKTTMFRSYQEIKKSELPPQDDQLLPKSFIDEYNNSLFISD